VSTAICEQRVPKADVGFGRHEEGAEKAAGWGVWRGREEMMGSSRKRTSKHPN
jgi:hypothetical protein